MLQIKFMNNSYEIGPRWMQYNTFGDESALVHDYDLVLSGNKSLSDPMMI